MIHGGRLQIMFLVTGIFDRSQLLYALCFSTFYSLAETSVVWYGGGMIRGMTHTTVN